MVHFDKYWLTLYPFTYFKTKKIKTIIYNTLTGEYEIFNTNNDVIKINKRLSSKKNIGTINLNLKHYNKSNIKKFITKIRSLYAGDLIPKFKNKKPVQITPYLKVQAEIVKKQTKNDYTNPFANELESHLNEIIIHLNESNDFFTNENYISLQTDYIIPRNHNSKDNQFSIDELAKVMSLSGKKFRIVGDLKNYTNKDKFFSIINKSINKTYFHTRINDITLSDINIFKDRKIILQWNDIYKYWDSVNIKKLKNNKVLKTQFFVQSLDDYKYIKSQINKEKIQRYSIFPYFNGKNYDFFYNNISLTKEEILNNKQKMIDIQIKQELNLNYYGRLSIKSNGDIYSNLNKSKVGNYFETSISECISFELDNKHGWKHTRKYIKPCNQCIYQYLCPSLSNYEYVMRKPNLCQVL
tara:strand:- start:443 stop:1675 length:1233 start_codon:yes stop_codon:yes gene_type:complete